MRKPLVAGNWKMNGSTGQINELLGGIKAGLSSIENTEVVVCPSSVYLTTVGEHIKGAEIKLGAQTLSEHNFGAYTGEVSGEMLKDLGCDYVIVGHSERRALFGENSKIVADKFSKAQKDGLIPILCVGEQLQDRESGNTEKVIAEQLGAILALEGGVNVLANSVIAYEPVWAIGTGKTASPDQAQAVHAFIRSKISVLNSDIADNLQILYGGSVKASNAGELFAMSDIDGGLIGGASLDANEFLAICTASN